MICYGKMKGSNANNNFYNRHQFRVCECELLKLIFGEATIRSLNFPFLLFFSPHKKETLTHSPSYHSPIFICSFEEGIFYSVGIHPNSQKLKMRLYFSIFLSNVSMSNASRHSQFHMSNCVPFKVKLYVVKCYFYFSHGVTDGESGERRIFASICCLMLRLYSTFPFGYVPVHFASFHFRMRN